MPQSKQTKGRKPAAKSPAKPATPAKPAPRVLTKAEEATLTLVAEFFPAFLERDLPRALPRPLVAILKDPANAEILEDVVIRPALKNKGSGTSLRLNYMIDEANKAALLSVGNFLASPKADGEADIHPSRLMNAPQSGGDYLALAQADARYVRIGSGVNINYLDDRVVALEKALTAKVSFTTKAKKGK